jgi:hypothetical protein
LERTYRHYTNKQTNRLIDLGSINQTWTNNACLLARTVGYKSIFFTTTISKRFSGVNQAMLVGFVSPAVWDDRSLRRARIPILFKFICLGLARPYWLASSALPYGMTARFDERGYQFYLS